MLYSLVRFLLSVEAEYYVQVDLWADQTDDAGKVSNFMEQASAAGQSMVQRGYV